MRFAEKKEIILPDGGWEEKTYYLVEVSWSSANPIHKAIFYTGFLNGYKGPGGYNQLYSGSYDHYEDHSISGVYYMKVIRELVSKEEMKSDG